MTPFHRLGQFIRIAAIAALASSPLQAATLYWQGGAGALVSNNYSAAATPQNASPTSADTLRIGANGTLTHSSGASSFQRLRVGNNAGASPGSAWTGSGEVTVSNGATIDLTAGTGTNPGLHVGEGEDGTLTIDGAGSSVTSANTIFIGTGNQPARQGTVNVTNGGSLVATSGNIVLGEGSGSGMQGYLNVHDAGSSVSGNALHIGFANTTSAYVQTDGTVSFNGAVEVGPNNSASDSSSFSVSGGTFSSGGNIFVGRGASTNATVTISGGTITVGGRFLMGGQTATGQTVHQTGGSITMSTLDLRVGDASSGESTYNLSGTGVINSPQGAWVGRQGTANFYQTGGTANFDTALQVGNWQGDPSLTTPPNALYQISAGDLSVGTNVSIATVAGGTGEFRIVGDDAAIDVGGDLALGGGAATLAFELQGTELLSVIDVTGTATFASGTSLVFDVTNAAPTQTVYDLLTAASIADDGIAFTGPAGWNYQVVSGGNGQILQAVYAIPEPATLGLALMAGLVALRLRRRG